MWHGMQGHVAEPRLAHARGKWRVGGVYMWQEATRVHADAQVVPRGRGDGRRRAHGLVGFGKIIGAVLQVLTAPLPFICTDLLVFLRVRLCPI